MSTAIGLEAAFLPICQGGSTRIICTQDRVVQYTYLLVEATHSGADILCRGCLASIKKTRNGLLLHPTSTTWLSPQTQKKRASNLRVRNTGTHVYSKKDD